ncbi:hypothetical protein QR680_001043 [Steinernema hermaphroditum]|uniref:G-protein coupled receptors family 1 profile domain-containing protein n=1 Tax=Steinernema hermaphroditum TaxID=289476 RepID=A0AA39LF56_9BILA|nr:hypothetical protein QR680_001043 [Steinernema hermaphroditum]
MDGLKVSMMFGPYLDSLSSVQNFVVNGTSPALAKRAFELQTSVWVNSVEISTLALAIVSIFFMSGCIVVLTKGRALFHENLTPLLLNLIFLVILRCIGMVTRLFYVLINRFFVYKTTSDFLQSAFACHLSTETPKLFFYSIGSTMVVLVVERIVAALFYRCYKKMVSRALLLLAFVISYAPSGIQIWLFVGETTELWHRNDVFVLYCNGRNSFSLHDPASKIWESTIEFYMIVVTGIVLFASITLYYLLPTIKRRYLSKNEYDLTTRHQLAENLRSSSIILWLCLSFILLQIITYAPHTVANFSPIEISDTLSIVFTEITTMMVPVFGIAVSVSTSLFCQQYMKLTILMRFFTYCCRPKPSTQAVQQDPEVASKNYGPGFGQHFETLITVWDKAYERKTTTSLS